jgi:hypothetical protein
MLYNDALKALLATQIGTLTGAYAQGMWSQTMVSTFGSGSKVVITRGSASAEITISGIEAREDNSIRVLLTTASSTPASFNLDDTARVSLRSPSGVHRLEDMTIGVGAATGKDCKASGNIVQGAALATHDFIIRAPQFAGSDLMNSVVVANNTDQAQTNHIVHIGRAFAEGELIWPRVVVNGQTDALAQITVKNRWVENDQATPMKFAIVALSPRTLTPGERLKVDFYPGGPARTYAAPNIAQLLSDHPDFDDILDYQAQDIGGANLGAVQTISLRNYLANGGRYTVWEHGPIVTTLHLVDHVTETLDVGESPKPCRVSAFVSFYHAGQKRNKTRWVLHKGGIATKFKTLRCALTFKRGSTVLLSVPGLISPAMARPNWTFWTGTPIEQLDYGPNAKYLSHAKFYPSFNVGVGLSPAATAGRDAQYDLGLAPMGKPIGQPFANYMPGPGGRAEIGIVTGWFAPAMQAAIGSRKNWLINHHAADNLCMFPMHMIEGDGNRLYDRVLWCGEDVPGKGLPVTHTGRYGVRSYDGNGYITQGGFGGNAQADNYNFLRISDFSDAVHSVVAVSATGVFTGVHNSVVPRLIDGAIGSEANQLFECGACTLEFDLGESKFVDQIIVHAPVLAHVPTRATVQAYTTTGEWQTIHNAVPNERKLEDGNTEPHHRTWAIAFNAYARRWRLILDQAYQASTIKIAEVEFKRYGQAWRTWMAPDVRSDSLVTDWSHGPCQHLPMYMVFGDPFYLETGLLWTHWSEQWVDIMYNGGQEVHQINDGWWSKEWGIISDQWRGQAWHIRTRSRAWLLCPDGSPMKRRLKRLTQNYLDAFSAQYCGPNPDNPTDQAPSNVRNRYAARLKWGDRLGAGTTLYNPLGFVPAWATANENGPTTPFANAVYAPWMRTYWMEMLAQCLDFGFDCQDLFDAYSNTILAYFWPTVQPSPVMVRAGAAYQQPMRNDGLTADGPTRTDDLVYHNIIDCANDPDNTSFGTPEAEMIAGWNGGLGYGDAYSIDFITGCSLVSGYSRHPARDLPFQWATNPISNGIQGRSAILFDGGNGGGARLESIKRNYVPRATKPAIVIQDVQLSATSLSCSVGGVATLTATVTNAQGQPVPNVVVYLRINRTDRLNPSAFVLKTDAQGRATFTVTPVGPVTDTPVGVQCHGLHRLARLTTV